MVLPIVHFSLTDCFSWHQVALSIRSTNVWVTVSFFLLWLWPICKFSYEERSLGIFEPPPDAEDEEPDDITKLPSRRERVGRYLGWHLRRQMSIGTSFAPSWCKVRVVLLTVRSNTGLDIWWLVWAVFIIAIIERKNLLDESKRWFDLFRIIFELVSAFGGIGLSLGFPSVCIMAFWVGSPFFVSSYKPCDVISKDNYSFVGVMSPLSKLVVIVIMCVIYVSWWTNCGNLMLIIIIIICHRVRGRHRGLPVTIDRAVLLPNELVVEGDEPK